MPEGLSDLFLSLFVFLLYISDIVTDIRASIRYFANETGLFIVVETPELAVQILNIDIGRIDRWAALWLVEFNPIKTESSLVSRKTKRPNHLLSTCLIKK